MMLIVFDKMNGGKIAVDPAQVSSVGEGDFYGKTCVWINLPGGKNIALDEAFSYVIAILNGAEMPQGAQSSAPAVGASLDDEIPF